jgi:cell division protein FtsQ
MWDRPAVLVFVANALLGVSAAVVVVFALVAGSHLPVFPLREVRVAGTVVQVTREQVERVVRHELRGNFFTIDLDAAREAFEKLPWVRRAQVRREWPGRLEVAIEEHVALARFGDDGLVDTHGEVFAAASDATLPLFVGPPEAATELAQRYAALRVALAPLGRVPVEVGVSARRAWSVVLDDGMRLELGRTAVEARLARFVAVYARTVAALPDRPSVVDLRYPNGFAVRLRPGATTTAMPSSSSAPDVMPVSARPGA